jgi:hypothetical protein
MNDLTLREKVVSASLVIAILWLGLFPKPLLDTAKPAILKTLNKQKEIAFQNLRGNTVNALWFYYPLPNLPSGGKEYNISGLKTKQGLRPSFPPWGK